MRFLDREALAEFGAPEDLFLNLNTPADLARWRQLEAADEEDEKS